MPVVDDQTVPSAEADDRSTQILRWLSLVLPAAAVISIYVILRWAPSPVEVAAVIGGLLVIGLSVAGYLGARRGVLAPYVAVALVLPYLLAAATIYGSASRVSDELEDFFSDDLSGDVASDGTDFDEGVEGGFEEESSPEDMAVPAGQVGYFEGFEVTVDALECGVESIPGAAENPEYWTSDDAPEFMDAVPPEGKTFCVVESTWTNASQKPESRPTYQTITGVIDDSGNQYSMSQDDETTSGLLTEQSGYDGSQLNPSDTAQIRNVFSVPEGTEVEYLVAVGYAFDSEEIAYFEAPASS